MNERVGDGDFLHQNPSSTLLLLFITSITTLINNEKRTGPKYDFYGISVRAIIDLDFMPITKTKCFRSAKQEKIKERKESRNPIISSL